MMKPKRDGWYQCTIRHGENMEKAYVTDLLYKARLNRWIDVHRQNVFEGYRVFNVRGPIDACLRVHIIGNLIVRYLKHYLAQIRLIKQGQILKLWKQD
jgi:hypothetical protein